MTLTKPGRLTLLASTAFVLALAGPALAADPMAAGAMASDHMSASPMASGPAASGAMANDHMAAGPMGADHMTSGPMRKKPKPHHRPAPTAATGAMGAMAH